MQALKYVFGGVALALAVAALPAQDDQATQGGQEGVSSQASGDRASRLTLRLKDRDLRDVIDSIRRKTSSNIIMEPGSGRMNFAISRISPSQR